MGISEAIALSALFISIISVWISYKAYLYSKKSNEAELDRNFSREKSEFLVRIEKAQKLFERFEQELAAEIERLNEEPDLVKSSLGIRTDKLISMQNSLEGCRRQALTLWEETYEMDQNGFAYHKPRFLKLIEDDEEFVKQAREELKSATEASIEYL